VEDLSDEEIATFFERAQSSGMTEAQLEKAAKAQGYTSADIAKMRSRLTQLGDNKSKEKTTTAKGKTSSKRSVSGKLSAKKGTKNADENIRTINKLKATYGPEIMPSLFKQLNKAGLDNDLQVVMSTNSVPLQKDILSAASNKDLEEQAKNKLSGSQLKLMEKEIFNKTKEYQEVILNQKSGGQGKTEYLLSLQKTLYSAALNRVVNSNFKITPTQAVESVTKEFKADYDTSPRTFFIPKDVNGIPVNIPAVKDKADALLFSVEKSDYLERFHGEDGFGHYGTLVGFQNALPENIKLSTKETFDSFVKEKMVNSMKKHSKWLLNNDSTGIILYVDLANGTIPIVNAKGEKIEFFFADMPNKNKNIKSTDMVEPVTGVPINIFNTQNYNVSP
jgi:hypothetical protein